MDGRPTVICVDAAEDAGRQLGAEIASLMRGHQSRGEPFVLGLAAGRSPADVYQELRRLHTSEALSFHNVVLFSLDEYLGVEAGGEASFEWSLRRELVDHVDVPETSVHLARVAPGESAEAACARHEAAIAQAGGIDLQLLGLGRNGHVAFNEPGTGRDSRTRRVELSAATREANASTLPAGVPMPTEAITMGLGTIGDARRLRFLAFGPTKTQAVERLLEGPADMAWPCSLLQAHPDAILWLDAAAMGRR